LPSLSSLSFKDFKTLVSRKGITLQIGSFNIYLQSSIATVHNGIYKLYHSYPILDAKEVFTDFFISIKRPHSLRRWYRPQVVFQIDGRQPFKPLPFSQAFPFFEWGLNWAIARHAHRYLIIHAATLEKNGKCVIIPGQPGAGKSTLCAALSLNGWRLLSDEMAMVQLSDGLIKPIPRPVSLKNDSIDIIKNFAPQAVIGNVAKDTSKGDVAHLRADEQAVSDHSCAIPQWIIIPAYTKNAKSELTARKKSDTFMHTIKNSFNYNVLGESGFWAATKLIEQCDCYQFTYSCLDDAVKIFDTLSE